MLRFHGTEPRGIDAVPQGPFYEGRFGRMFSKVPVFESHPDALRELADRMQESAGSPADNPSIPAGFTYLGQFVDHDITFDPTSSLDRANDPEALANFRSPRFDLDCIYGRGPDDEPFLYDRESENRIFLIGQVLEDDRSPREPREDDLQRNVQGRALIGDPRNDENTIVSQLQLTFLKFHNKLVAKVAAEGRVRQEEVFKEAQRLARWHYQWVVVHDFLPRVIGRDLFDRLVTTEPDGTEEVHLRFYRWTKNPYMPLEFSVAAYRFGHTQIRPTYRINKLVEQPTFTPGPLQSRTQDFRGFRGLPPRWTVDWPFFFELDDEGPQPSRIIDSRLASPLFSLPDESTDDRKSLARRNLLRGLAMKLPSGDRVAQAMGVAPLTPTQLEFDQPAPLWYYILKEAEVLTGGAHLGPVGGRIVGETLLGLLRADPLSYYHVAPSWKPELPTSGADPGAFSMVDLLRFAVPEQIDRPDR